MWYVETFLAKNKSFFKCKECSNLLKVLINPGAFKFLGSIEFLSVIIFAVSVFLGGRYCFLGLMMIFSLFGVFYVFSPFFVKFVKVSGKRKSGQHDLTGVQKKRSGKDTDTEIFSN